MARKSYPFLIRQGIPFDISEGGMIEFPSNDGSAPTKGKVTKIKHVRFLDMRTIEIQGLVRNVE